MKNRKAFTIIELVIVIAIIAILAAVLIPVFGNIIKTARTSFDMQLVRNLNTTLAVNQATDGSNKTMKDALDDVFKSGYDVTKITPTNADNEILWDQTCDRFVLLYANGTYEALGKDVDKPIPSGNDIYKLWKIYTDSNISEHSEASANDKENYSIYWNGGDLESITVSVGFDAGTANVASVTYENDSAKDVVIRTNSTSTILTINAPNDEVYHYDKAGIVNIMSVNTASYHENGEVPFLEVAGGHVVLEPEANVTVFYFDVTGTGDTAKFENTDGKKISVDLSKISEDRMPQFSRSDVTIAENGTYVAEVKTDTTEYIWLFGSGIKEQMVVTNQSESIAENGTLKEGITAGAEDGSIAEQIANPAKRNGQGQLVDADDNLIDVSAVAWENENALDTLTSVIVGIPESKESIKDEVAAEAVNTQISSENPDYVFRIGTTGYYSLAEVNNAITSSCTVYMLKDYVQSGGIEFLYGKTNLTIVMDLGGHTLAPASWFDVHNSGGSITIKNGAFEGNARIYLEVSNVHLILENIVFDRTDNSSNKFIMFTKDLGTVEVINCTITGDNTGDEYFLGNFKGGETIIIENTTINWYQTTWIQDTANYDANKPSYIEFRGTSAIYYSDNNIDFTANYESELVSDSAVRYTLIESRDTWVQHCASEFESVDEENKTITIATAAQLGLLAKNVNEGTTYEGYTITLSANINLSDYDWAPIGYFDSENGSRSFKGTFDGQNHSITGLKNVTKLTNKGVGLFGQVSTAIIRNISVSGTIKSNQMYTGGIVGHGYATLTNCSFSGNVSGGLQVGGICGSGGFTITDCTYTGNVSGNCWIGGITGNCQDGGAYTNCTVNGNVTALYVGNISGGVGTGVGYAGGGGIAGLVCYNTQVFENCTFTGTIKEAGVVVASKLAGGYLE